MLHESLQYYLEMHQEVTHPISILGAGSYEFCIALASLQVRISRNDAWVNHDPGVVSYISPVSLM